MTSAPRCPCGSGELYSACCERLHSGEAVAPTATALMRSRFSAFARDDPDSLLATYLLVTWHPSTRPRTVELDEDRRWTRLEILDAVGGGPFDSTGVVEFRAHHHTAGTRGVLHERSSFVREGGRWFYVSGDLT